MDTQRHFFKFIIPFLVAVLAFVYIAQPISAKADSASLSYQTTSMSLQEVKAFISAGSAATISVTLVILGFIALTYCTLRNVEVPLQFSSKQSFFDKCKQLGQYMLDNATDSIKDVLYSVYTYCQDNGITSPIGLSKFLMVNAIKFFGAISNWLSSSFVSNVQPVAQGFLDSFGQSLSLDLEFSYTYTSSFIPVFNSASSVLFSSTIGGFATFSSKQFYHYMYFDSLPSILVVYGSGDELSLYGYSLVGDTLQPMFFDMHFGEFQYSSGASSPNVAPSLSSYSTSVYGPYSYQIYTFGLTSQYFYDVNSILTFLSSLGISVGTLDHYVQPNTSISIDDVTWASEGGLVSAISDTVYVPTDDEIELDPDGVADDLVGAAAGALTLDWLIKLLTQDRSLTLTSALPDSSRVNGAGTYAFPDFTGIWKYPRYFFNTLGSWLLFVGGCLNAVTVGEGGLSWLFYGGFVFLICGGVIGKILLG